MSSEYRRTGMALIILACCLIPVVSSAKQSGPGAGMQTANNRGDRSSNIFEPYQYFPPDLSNIIFAPTDATLFVPAPGVLHAERAADTQPAVNDMARWGFVPSPGKLSFNPITVIDNLTLIVQYHY